LANSVDPDETPHDAASHQGLRCLLKGIYVRNILNIEINILDIPNFGNKLIQFRRMGESTRHKWVNKIIIQMIMLIRITDIDTIPERSHIFLVEHWRTVEVDSKRTADYYFVILVCVQKV